MLDLTQPLTVTNTDVGSTIETIFNGQSFPATPRRPSYTTIRSSDPANRSLNPLTIIDQRTIADSRSSVIRSWLGNHTLSFFGDVAIKAEHRIDQPHELVQLFAVRTIGDTINFKKNLTIENSSFTGVASTNTSYTPSLVSLFQAMNNGNNRYTQTGIVFGASDDHQRLTLTNIQASLDAPQARMTIFNTQAGNDVRILNYNQTTIKDIDFTSTGEYNSLHVALAESGLIRNEARLDIEDLRLTSTHSEASFNYLSAMQTTSRGTLVNVAPVSIKNLTLHTDFDPTHSSHADNTPQFPTDSQIFGMRAVNNTLDSGVNLTNEASVSIAHLRIEGISDQTIVGAQAEDGSAMTFSNLSVNDLRTSANALSALVSGVRVVNDGDIEVMGTAQIKDLQAPTGTVAAIETAPGRIHFTNQVLIHRLSGESVYSVSAINDSDDNEIASEITLARAAHQIEGDMVSRRALDSDTITYTEGKATLRAEFDGSTSYFKGWTHLGHPEEAQSTDPSTLDLSFTNGARWEMVSSNPTTLGVTPSARLTSLTLSGASVYLGTTQADFANANTLFATERAR